MVAVSYIRYTAKLEEFFTDLTQSMQVSIAEFVAKLQVEVPRVYRPELLVFDLNEDRSGLLISALFSHELPLYVQEISLKILNEQPILEMVAGYLLLYRASCRRWKLIPLVKPINLDVVMDDTSQEVSV